MKTTPVVLSGARGAWICALTGIAIALGSAPAQSQEARSRTVKYAELDLSKQAGAEVLYRRIKQAAASVCGPESVSLRPIRKTKCYKEAVANAVEQVNSPLLTQLHTGSTERMASR